jgi:23S rRNA (cytidine1920-2'-O)/16S rRNA (cytidine1409-2'-O)-methyltransferase
MPDARQDIMQAKNVMPPKTSKIRLDTLVHQRGLAPSREAARRLIMAGQVQLGGQVADKVGALVAEDADLALVAPPPYVSRGGEKLAEAFTAFAPQGLSVQGLICADVGASTGGFTDCLLQHGAAKVYALDVGYGQMALKLRDDPRVIVMERTNARYVASLPESVGLATIDASFISLKLLLPVVKNWLSAPPHSALVLIKPQFEAGKKDVGKGGVVRDEGVHRRVLQEVLAFAQGLGFTVRGVVRSPLVGPKGNVEFLAWLSLDAPATSYDWEAGLMALFPAPPAEDALF